MELDDLKGAWQTLDRRLQQQHDLNLQLFRQGKLERMKSGLRPLFWGQVLQMLFGAAIVLWAGASWPGHRDVPHVLVAGLLVHAYGIAVIIAGGLVLGHMAQIDHAAPVLAIQKQLAKVRALYVRGGMLVGLSWALIWIPMLMLLVANLGGDLYAHAPSVVWIGGGVGIAVLLATLWFHHWSRHPSRPRLAKAMEASVTGGSLRKAQAQLDEIARFEQE